MKTQSKSLKHSVAVICYLKCVHVYVRVGVCKLRERGSENEMGSTLYSAKVSTHISCKCVNFSLSLLLKRKMLRTYF